MLTEIEVVSTFSVLIDVLPVLTWFKSAKGKGNEKEKEKEIIYLSISDDKRYVEMHSI